MRLSDEQVRATVEPMADFVMACRSMTDGEASADVLVAAAVQLVREAAKRTSLNEAVALFAAGLNLMEKQG